MYHSSTVHIPPSLALQISRQAPNVLRNTTPVKFLDFLISNESSDLWFTYEGLILTCLRTGDEKSAHTSLQRLIDRFGADNERVMALAGLYKEAVSRDDGELYSILEEYDSILLQDPTNMPVFKRRITLLTSLGKSADAISSLIKFLDSSPNDTEAWAELSDLYVTQGMYPQAIFALEELLLVTPYAWNIHARLGEVLYISGSLAKIGMEKLMIDSLQRFCRSIELCDNYLRGYYGLKIVTDRLLALQDLGNPNSELGLSFSSQKLKNLNEVAVTKLSEIIRRSARNELGWQGYEMTELIAAKEVLDHRSVSQSMTR